MRWLERLEDRCPVWALPWLLLALIAAVVGAAAGTGWEVARCAPRRSRPRSLTRPA